MNQFSLVQAVDRFSQRIVVAADRWLDARFGQPLDRATYHRDTFPVRLLPDFVRSVGLHVGMPNTHDLRPWKLIAFRAGAVPRRIAKLCGMAPVPRRGNSQDLADRLDPEGDATLINKGLQDFSRRSSSTWAKSALASFKISLVRRSSFTSRSSALRRSRSDVVTPSRSPLSTSSRLPHPNSVWLVHPILGAMDSIAAHCHGYSSRCFHTMRTARFLTSAENLFDLFMAPFSRELEPPPKSGRFIALLCLILCLPGAAHAHIQWFATVDLHDAPRSPFSMMASPQFLALAAAAVVVMSAVGLICAWLAASRASNKIAAVLHDHHIGENATTIMRVGMAAFFVALVWYYRAEPVVLTPELKANAWWLHPLQFGIAVAAVSRRPALAAGLLTSVRPC
jgi:hypothetical protein